MSEHAVLMELVEAVDDVEPDWEDALRRAGFMARRFPRRPPAERRPRRRRIRRVLVVAVLLLTAAFAISALAADRPHRIVYWLFDRSPETYPQVQVPTLHPWHEGQRAGFGPLIKTDHGLEPRIMTVPVLEGEVAGHRFEMEAFLTDVLNPNRPPDLVVGFNPGGVPKPYYGTNIPAAAGGGFGFPVYGLPRAFPERDLHWVGWSLLVPGPIASGGGRGPKYLSGPAATNVRRVDLVSGDGSVVSVPTFPGPSSLGVPVRLWVAVLRLDHLVQTIVPRDANGRALEQWHLDQAQ
jgi:hypothetical protein